MTNAIGRFWATALALVVFFILWAVLAAKPWGSGSTPTDPRLAALQAREQKVQNQALAAQQTLSKRWAAYRAALLKHKSSLTPQQRAQLAAAPAGPSVIVKVTGAAPVTQSTTSRPAVAAPAVGPVTSSLPGQSTVAPASGGQGRGQ